jgi:hypothetical protein
MAKGNNTGKNAGTNAQTSVNATSETTQAGETSQASTTSQTEAGPRKSTLLPTTSEKREAGKKAVSPAALTSLSVGSSLAGISLIGIGGKPRGTGGRTSNGEKPKLLAIFGIAYAKYNEIGKLICNNQLALEFVANMAKTKENRMVLVANSAQQLVAKCAWSEVPATMVELGIAETIEAITLNERGGWSIPGGHFIVPVYTVLTTKDTLASFRRYSDLAEHYMQLANNEADAETKAQYLELAKGFGEGDAYQGFACSTLEVVDGVSNAVRLATRVREFFAMNPEYVREDIFNELPVWEPVFGQKDIAPVVNADWANTTEGIAQAEAEAVAEAETEQAEA